MAELRRQDKPPAPGPACEIFRIKGTQRVHFWCLSDDIWGVWTHWGNNRTNPCTGESKETCEGHAKEWPLRWKGYLCVFDVFRGKLGFYELTPGAAQQIERQTTAGQTLRGRVLICSRSSEGKGSRARVEVQPYLTDLTRLPDARDPELYLRQLWKCN